MKRTVMVCMMLMLGTTFVMAEAGITRKAKPMYLYVLSAKSGMFEGDKLTLKDIPRVIYFSNRPKRIADHMSLKKFVKMWVKGVNSFKEDPPNATISIFEKSGNKNVVLELRNPELKGDALTFNVRILEGKMSKSFKPSSLFIDDGDACGGDLCIK